MSIMGTVASGIGLNLITNIIWDKKMQRDNKLAIKQIKTIIGSFNSQYDNTEIDTFAFQNFIEKTEVIESIYKRVFQSFQNEKNENIIEFKKLIAQNAIDNINQYYEPLGRKVHNEEIFFQYFFELIDSVIEIRDSLLTLEMSAQTSILTDKLELTQKQIKEDLEIQIAKMKEDNVFAEEKLNEIYNLINLYKFHQAEEELSHILESLHLLSDHQKEFVYYQKARIYIKKDEYQKLDDVIQNISRYNTDSKYIAEINYQISLKRKDISLFEESLQAFKKNNYSNENILIKTINYKINNEKYKEAWELLTDNDELKTNLLESHEAYYFYGVLLAQNGKLDMALGAFSAAFNLHKNMAYKFSYIVVKANIQVSNREAQIFKLHDDVFQEIKEDIKEFENLEYLLEFLPFEEKMNYWTLLINLLLMVNPKEALHKIQSINDFDDNNFFLSLKADVYLKNNLKDKAKVILQSIFEYLEINTINYFIILNEESDWHTIISQYNKLSSSEFKCNPNIFMLYLKARYMTKGYENIRKELIDVINSESDSIPVNIELLRITIEAKDDRLYNKVISSLHSKKDKTHEEELRVYGEVLNSYEKYYDSRSLLREHLEKSEELFKVFISTFIQINQFSRETLEVYEITKELYRKGVKYNSLLKFKVDIEMRLGLARKAIQTLEDYRTTFGIDEYYAYYFVVAKMEKGDLEGLDNEIEYLLKSNESNNLQLVSHLKARLGMWDDAQRTALRALFLLPEQLEEKILMNYISMHFSNIDKEQKDLDLDEVRVNTVVIIKSEDKYRNIAIHGDKSIVKKSGEIKYGCENYSFDDSISLLLVSLGRKGEKIKLQDDNYEVVDIVNLYGYFQNYCIKKLQEDFPDHNYFISYSTEDPVKLKNNLEETMKLVGEERTQQLSNYNFGIEIGMPLSYLSGKNVDSYSEMIVSLLNHKNQHLYAGEVNIYKDSEYVLSISSLIMLAYLGLLDKLETISSKCSITTYVEKSIREGIKEAQKHAKTSSGIMYLSEEGELRGYNYNENDKINRKTFWTNILLSITDMNKFEVEIEEHSLYETIPNILLDEDLSSIDLSKNSNKIFVCDDLFIRKLYHGVTQKNNTTNVIGFLLSEKLLSPTELLDLILRLVKEKYLYPINSEIVTSLILYINQIEDKAERDVNLKKLKEVYNNILNEQSRSYYKNIHEEVIKEIHAYGLPAGFLYELVREPFKLKPYNLFVEEKKKEILKIYFGNKS
ncbi:hypothetical protein IHV09_22170 [Fictibacillus sp. 23RED33]|uniref:PIN domain-containing protein n=1 Tax=Fictibacillus sp. 23RED33 TaxID=2745879 RepID=UPI0018CC90BC|nr:hypothetical protein [Fictibacillus sp. 23RED33]MBH0176267.1 hypothetical protein [Fictibacillus sp. 23RED33]